MKHVESEDSAALPSPQKEKERATEYRRALNKHIETIERETGAMKFTLDAMVERIPDLVALPSSPAPTQPQLFRTRPVEKWAIQWDGSNTKQVLSFIGDGAWYTSDGDVEFLQIETLEGRMRASIWDWIIKGVNGEFYPCKPDIFAATYESVSSEKAEEVSKVEREEGK